MKHLSIVIVFLLITFSAKAQFVLTHNGFATDDDKDFYVLNFEGKNQQELYDAVEIWAGGRYISPKDVVSPSINAAQITINAVVVGLTKMPKRAIKVPVDVNYTFQILFKDNKIRFNTPVINSMDADGQIEQQLYLVRPSVITDGIFSKSGKLLDKYSKEQLEKHFNEIVEEVRRLVSGLDEEW